MGQVLLVRHGQASWGAEDYDVLSEAGRAQSRLLGSALAARGITPSVIVHGSMQRHRDTAAGMLEGLAGPEPVVDEGWNEFDHLEMLRVLPAPHGDREPTPAEFQAWFEDATDRWTGGRHDADYSESFAGFCARVEAALGRTAQQVAQSPGGVVVVSTSGGPVSWAVASLLGAELDQGSRTRLWRRLNPVCVNTGVTKVVTGRRGLSLVSFNEHTHLDLTPDLLTYR